MKIQKHLNYDKLENGDVLVFKFTGDENSRFAIRILHVFIEDIEDDKAKEKMIWGLCDEAIHSVLCIHKSLQKCVEYLDQIWNDLELVKIISRWEVEYNNEKGRIIVEDQE